MLDLQRSEVADPEPMPHMPSSLAPAFIPVTATLSCRDVTVFSDFDSAL